MKPREGSSPGFQGCSVLVQEERTVELWEVTGSHTNQSSLLGEGHQGKDLAEQAGSG